MPRTREAAPIVGGRQALIDAAVAAIEEDGLAGLSLRSITRRAQVSHAAPAHHFGDKAGMFSAVALQGFELLQAAMRTAIEEARPKGPVRQMQAIAVAYVTFASEHRAHFEVMFRPELCRPDDTGVAQAGMATFELLRDIVRAARDDGFGHSADVDRLTLAAWSLVHGVVQLTNQGVLGHLGFPDSAIDLAMSLTGALNDVLDDTSRGTSTR